MAETRIPEVIDALYAQATAALPEVLVCDGEPLGEWPDTQDMLLIGVEDPVDEARADAADGERVFAAGRSQNEAAEIRCCILTTDPDSIAKGARDRATAIMAAVANLTRGSSPQLGRQNVWGASVSSVRYYQQLTEYGAECLLVFSLRFVGRI